MPLSERAQMEMGKSTKTNVYLRPIPCSESHTGVLSVNQRFYLYSRLSSHSD